MFVIPSTQLGCLTWKLHRILSKVLYYWKSFQKIASYQLPELCVYSQEWFNSGDWTASDIELLNKNFIRDIRSSGMLRDVGW